MQNINLKHYDLIITFGLYDKDIKSDVCFYPFLDTQTDLYIRYEVGTEEGVSALLLYEFSHQQKYLKDYLDQLDYAYLSAETNIGEEELIEVKTLVVNKHNPLLLIGEDIFSHSQKDNMIKIIQTLKASSSIEIAFVKNNQITPIHKQIHTLDYPLDLPENNGCMIYINPLLSPNTTLKISKEFAKIWKIKNQAKITIAFDDFSFDTICHIDDNFGGIIGIFNHTKAIDCNYRFKKIAIKR